MAHLSGLAGSHGCALRRTQRGLPKGLLSLGSAQRTQEEFDWCLVTPISVFPVLPKGASSGGISNCLFDLFHRRQQTIAIELLLFDWRWACPMLLCNRIGPSRTQGRQNKPGLRELAIHHSVGLHACLGLGLTGFGIVPLECKAKPRAVALEGMIVNNNAYTWPSFMNLCDFCRVLIAGHRPVALLVVPDIGWAC